MKPPIEVTGVPGQCPICNHPPIRHIADGTGSTCLVCLYLSQHARGSMIPHKVCTLAFEFKLSLREREQAQKAAKNSYPPRTICAECYCYWEAHEGFLCPSGDSTFRPLLDKDLPYIRVK